MIYPATEYRSIDELCQLVHRATDGWDTKWYRGVKSPNHQLLPKLFRDPNLAKREGYIGVEFRRRARSHLPNITSSFEWLCAMQHYDVPTRLLDWSESLAVALYFTIRPIGLDLIAPTIWVLDPFKLFQLSDPQREIIPISTSMEVRANTDLTFGDEDEQIAKQTSSLPIPVAPDFLFHRLALQNGAFTLHGKEQKPLEELIPTDKREMLHKFVARRDSVRDIYASIDLLAPSSDALFPDIEGLKDYIV